MKFTSNVAGWTQLTQLFDFLSFFGDGMIDICDITFALYTFSHEYLCPKATQFWVAYWGKKEKKVAAIVPIWDAIAVIPHWRITRSAQQQVQKHSFYRKNQKFLVLELSSYILSVPSFSSLCWPYFSLEFPPFFGHCLLSTTDKTKVFFMDPFSRNNLFHPFSRFFSAEK